MKVMREYELPQWHNFDQLALEMTGIYTNGAQRIAQGEGPPGHVWLMARWPALPTYESALWTPGCKIGWVIADPPEEVGHVRRLAAGSVAAVDRVRDAPLPLPPTVPSHVLPE